MSKFASVCRSVLGAAALAALAAPGLGIAADADSESDGAQPPVETPVPANFECYKEALTGSGPGFSASREKSEDTAKADWLKKAQAVMSKATWEMAKDPDLTCVVQGLYSKCFATGVPCQPKSEGAGGESSTPNSAEHPSTSEETTKSE
jgi:hypothetical protein